MPDPYPPEDDDEEGPMTFLERLGIFIDRRKGVFCFCPGPWFSLTLSAFICMSHLNIGKYRLCLHRTKQLMSGWHHRIAWMKLPSPTADGYDQMWSFIVVTEFERTREGEWGEE